MKGTEEEIKNDEPGEVLKNATKEKGENYKEHGLN